MKLERIYHNWEKWECYKHGFYNIVSNAQKQECKKLVLSFFNDAKTTEYYMQKIIDKWIYSCEHFLSNVSMNRIAWLGQAACCLCHNTPNLVTMLYWNFLEESVQIRSNNIAQNIITNWEQKIKLNDISSNGNKKDIQMGYQMKLRLNLKKED
jgi:hypothetical protein